MSDTFRDLGFPFTDQSGDRQYSSEDWRLYFDALVTGGVVGAITNELQVKPQIVANKSIFVDLGAIIIQGAMRKIEATQTLSIADNISGNPRIDRVVARLNLTDRKIEFAVVQGVPGASPSAPAVTRNASTYEYSLAKIAVANGFSTIVVGNITDERLDEAVCGYFKYRAKPAWYPGGVPPIDMWMYSNFRMLLTTQEVANIEANPSLMAMYATSDINRLSLSIERIMYDEYSNYLKLYYSGQLDGADFGYMKGLALDGFMNTVNVDVPKTTAIVDTSGRLVKCGKLNVDGLSINPTIAGSTNNVNSGTSAYCIITMPRNGFLYGVGIDSSYLSAFGSTLNVCVRAVDANNKPTGANLAAVSMGTGGSNITFSDIACSAGQKFAIIFYSNAAYATTFPMSYSNPLNPNIPMGGTGNQACTVFNDPVTTPAQVVAPRIYQRGNYGNTKLVSIKKSFGLAKVEELKLFISTLERANSSIVSIKASVDNGVTYENLTLVSSRTDPRFVTYTEKEYKLIPAAMGSDVILEVVFDSVDGLAFSEVKRYGIYVK